MTGRLLTTAAVIAVCAIPLAACQTAGGAASGAAGGAVAGAVVGGPVGAAVGGVAGAAIGGALSAEESARVHDYVVAQRVRPVRVRDRIVVGQPLPRRIRYYPLPPDVGLSADYGYSVVNGRTVIVEPRTRRVVQFID